MQTLYHLWLSPYCRKVRIVLHEKKIDFDLKVEKVWERRQDFLALNPAGDVPVLVEAGGTALSGSDVISEFLDEIHPEPPLLGRHPLERAEVRRLIGWFDRKFNAEVTEKLIGEKVMKRFLGLGAPDSKAIRAGHANIHTHLDYVSYLIERRKWLSGNEMTLADITAAAHFSAIDYLGDVPWDEHPGAKDWYARIKSRPSFRAILGDHIPGVPPSKHYADLDF
ncbi:MAG: glutathione S-transferase family protein [Rhodospirillaceae bacterium]|jgi:glutathione S-transferase|nr:glutathione S-transferase family protein [Rhodospirillaceae bacterium]MBT4218504.1 glutathione S-transferase family protein [Rhodospirillaceae bacterium]MBT4464888.1 glutathione S-transferase family protein [Rhodospirillaceae bacterium]MBT5014095.1 glutathione S-transferase family protein [Rhodospirillaceae bacterium]MBT5308376.1 glutathione S-transferase family protein [Rhodospirillaceae bacterium]